MVFWSAAREEVGCFFYNTIFISTCHYHPGLGETNLRFLSLLEERILPLLLALLLLGEVVRLAHFLQCLLIEAFYLDLCGCGDHVAGVYAAEGDAIDFEGARDKEDALGEVFEEDDALAAEAACEEDEDGAGGEGLAGPGRVDGLADLRVLLVDAMVAWDFRYGMEG